MNKDNCQKEADEFNSKWDDLEFMCAYMDRKCTFRCMAFVPSMPEIDGDGYKKMLGRGLFPQLEYQALEYKTKWPSCKRMDCDKPIIDKNWGVI